MIKVSLTLPNNVQITLESDSDFVHEIMGTILRDLPKELLSGGLPLLNGPSLNETQQLIISRLEELLSRLQVLLEDQNAVQISLPENGAPVNGAASSPPVPENPTEKNLSPAGTRTSSFHQDAGAGLPAAASEDSFIQFCRSVNPLGDMRRVVVAIEGAELFLWADGVDSEELSRLFDMAGWPQPHSLTQTLRNAARSKFRWIERIPGRNGCYSVTDKGKEISRQS